jgi:sorbose reductase
VTSYDEVEAALEQTIKEFDGRLDVFVANSGASWGDEAFMKINVDGVVYCARAAGKHFRRQKKDGTTIDGAKLSNFSSGSFIATASMSGHIVNIPRRQAAYNASKAHIIQLCKLTHRLIHF